MLEKFTWYKQSAYRWKGDGITVYIDPWGTSTSDEPADVIFITHAHSDHFQPDEIARLKKDKTQIIAPRDVAKELGGNVKAVKPGDSLDVVGIKVQAVPAYNIKPQRAQAHPKSNQWVGYILTLGGHSYYHAGDTDHLPELEQVKAEVAMVPIGGDPYIMDAREAAALVKKIKPQLAVPMHYGYVVGVSEDADTFAKAASPIKVQLLRPVHAFEKTTAAAH